MKTKLLLSLILLCCVTYFGQEKADTQKAKTQQIILKKQIAVDDLESQVKDIPFAVVRVFVRYKLAEWLWKDGKDETGRAEPLIIKATDDLFKNESEIPSFYFISLKSDIFALLEIKSKDTAKILTDKYKEKFEFDLGDAHSLLETKGSEKIAVEKILKILGNQSELTSNQEHKVFGISLLLGKLQERKSPETNIILSTILALDESGKSNLSAESLISLLPYFRDSWVSNDLRIRLYRIILNDGKETIINSDANVESSNRLLGYVLYDISVNAPNFSGEANALKVVLNSKLSKAEYEVREREKRISESPDKVNAVISEAEKTEDESTKYVLYSRAARLALSQQKFNLGVDLAEKTLEGDSKDIPENFRKGWHDQFLREVVNASLKKEEIESANYAVKKMIAPLSKTDSLCDVAVFYSKKQDTISAIDSYNEALKLTEKAEISNLKFYTLFRLISSIQEIDKTRISEIAIIIAKNIDDITTLGIDDKPETENYKNYVSSMMAINYNLLPVISKLAKENKNEAINFADRISRKEIKIVANFALMVAEIKFEEKLAKN